MTIWKYVVTPEMVLDLPGATAEVLSVGAQPGIGVVAWARVFPESAERRRVKLHGYGTGHEMPPNPGRFIGTVGFGGMWFHVFSEED